MKITSESKVFLSIIAATVLIIGVAATALSRPEKPIVRDILIPTTAATRGNPDASVSLVEFSDFQCPSCRDAKPTIDTLVTQYENRLLFVYRHFPLDQHPFAQLAAEAAEAAGAQGKFWEMYDALFAHQDVLSAVKIQELANDLNLDSDQFAQDLDNGTYRDKVLRDRNDAVALGVNATPTFYLNGKNLVLSSFDDLITAVIQALQK